MLLILQAAATFYMTGVIWMVQLAHYPLFARVDAASFPEYERRYTRRMGWVVIPPMLAELALALEMALRPPPAADAGLAWMGLALVAVLWLSTFTLQVPCHCRLESAFDRDVWRRLVRTNWIRTAGWTLRSVLLAWVLRRSLG